MEDFLRCESSRFVGRARVIDDVSEFVSSDADVPLVISGAHGVGKTALVAKLHALFNREGLAKDALVAGFVADGRDRDISRTLKRSSLDSEEDENSLSSSTESLSCILPKTPFTSGFSSSDSTSLRRLESHCRDDRPPSSFAQRCLTHVTGLVSTPVISMDDFLRDVLVFLRFSYDVAVARVCRNLATLTREALSIDYDQSRILVLDGIQFLRGEGSVASKLSWIPLKLGKNVAVILTLSTDDLCQRFLNELLSREQKPKVTVLPPLEKEEIKSFLRSDATLSEESGPLLPDFVAEKKDAGNPLWLHLLCLELERVSPRLHSGKVKEMEEGLEDRICQLLLKYPLVKPGEERCRRVSCDTLQDLVSGALCLLCVSDHGLSETELCELLSDADHLLPPSEHVEKGESERSEKSSRLVPKTLAADVWAKVKSSLMPLLQPSISRVTWAEGEEFRCEDGNDEVHEGGFLSFHHSVLQTGAHRFFFGGYDGSESEKTVTAEFYRHKIWWHTNLAKYFEKCPDVRRKAEEYPRHLKALGDTDRLAEYLTNWDNFDTFFAEDTLSPEKLQKYWEYAGGSDVMVDRYALNLKVGEDLMKDEISQHLENNVSRPDNERVGSQIYDNNKSSNGENFNNNNNNNNDVSRTGCGVSSSPSLSSRDDILFKYEKVAELLMTAGSYVTAIEMTLHAIDVESSFGGRPVRLAGLYDLVSKGYTEIVKMFDFASEQQLPHIQKAIQYGRKAIAIREAFFVDGNSGGEISWKRRVRQQQQQPQPPVDERQGGTNHSIGREKNDDYDDDDDEAVEKLHEDSSTSCSSLPSAETSVSAEASSASGDSEIEDVRDSNLILERHRLGLSRMNLAFNLDSWDGTLLAAG